MKYDLNFILRNLKENRKRYKKQISILERDLDKAIKNYELCEEQIEITEKFKKEEEKWNQIILFTQ